MRGSHSPTTTTLRSGLECRPHVTRTLPPALPAPGPPAPRDRIRAGPWRTHDPELPRDRRQDRRAHARVRRHADQLPPPDGLAPEPRLPVRRHRRPARQPRGEEAAPGQGGARHLRRRVPVGLRPRLAGAQDVPHPGRGERGGQLARTEAARRPRREAAAEGGDDLLGSAARDAAERPGGGGQPLLGPAPGHPREPAGKPAASGDQPALAPGREAPRGRGLLPPPHRGRPGAKRGRDQEAHRQGAAGDHLALRPLQRHHGGHRRAPRLPGRAHAARRGQRPGHAAPGAPPAHRRRRFSRSRPSRGNWRSARRTSPTRTGPSPSPTSTSTRSTTPTRPSRSATCRTCSIGSSG